jgi:hypothetical protein
MLVVVNHGIQRIFHTERLRVLTHENTINLLMADIIATDHRGMVMNHDQFAYHSSQSYS